MECGAVGKMLWIRLGTWGTHFELTENTLGTTKIQHPHIPQKEKKPWAP